MMGPTPTLMKSKHFGEPSDRLLAAQERRRIGEKILWDTYQKSIAKIDGLSKAISDIRNIKINLTDKEKEFVSGSSSSRWGVFKFRSCIPGSRSRLW